MPAKSFSDGVRRIIKELKGAIGSDIGSDSQNFVAPKPRKIYMPDDAYRAGIDPEHDYFNPPKMAKAMKKGGKVTKKKRDGLAQRGRTKGAMR